MKIKTCKNGNSCLNRYPTCFQVFTSLPDSALSLGASRHLEEKIDEVCWLVCQKRYLDQRERPVFQDHCVYKLFRIFCLLAELVPDDSTDFHDCFQVKIILKL
jgi:hypothetical protein